MNKNLKSVIIILNIIMLIVAGYWLFNNREPEPLVVIIGQLTVLISLTFEKKASKIFTKGIDNSEVLIKRGNSDKVHTEDIKDSKIDIQ